MSSKKSNDSNTVSFIEGIDFYYNDSGLMVLTEKYHLKRGFCCHSDCLHCPYELEEKGNADIPRELQGPQVENPWDEYLDYEEPEEED